MLDMLDMLGMLDMLFGWGLELSPKEHNHTKL